MRGVCRLVVLLACLCGLLASAGAASAQQVLYGADGGGANPSNLYILNPSSGAVLQTVGPIGFPVTGLALDPTTGTLYGAVGGRRGTNADPHRGFLIKIDRTTGAGTVIGDEVPDDEAAADITITPDGTLYGWLEPTTDDLVTINKSTGAATVVGDSGLNTYGSGLASNSAGVLFLAGFGQNGPLWTINRSTGAATQVATLNGPDIFAVSALAFNAAGTLFGSLLPSMPGVTSPSFLITINTSSGAVTNLGRAVDAFDSLVFAPKPGRSVNLNANKKKVKKGKKVRLFGQVDAPRNEAACEVGQAVELQKKKPKAASFQTLRQLTTDTAGNFSTKVKVKKTLQYRAFLPESALCDDETSNTKKVKVKKKK